MCGRYTLVQADEAQLRRRFGVKNVPPRMAPRFNISPSQDVPVILNQNPDEITFVRWGLVPPWAREERIGNSMINARAEGIEKKPSFSIPIRRRRCLVLADSFFEWKQVGKRKIPYRLTLGAQELFAFAGLWDIWEKDGAVLRSCAIITSGANEFMRGVHDRMPVILPRAQEQTWLNSGDLKEVLSLLSPREIPEMTMYEVSPLVNLPQNDSADVVKPFVPSE